MSNARHLETGIKLAAVLILTFCGLTPSATSGDEPASHQVDRQVKRPADRNAIRAVLDAQEEAWNRGDIDAFLKGYWHSPNLTFSGSNGIFRGWDAVMARY